MMKARQKPEHVCPQDCPERSATCHGTCSRYLGYHTKQREEYRKRETAVRIDGYAVDAMVRCMHRPPIVLNRKSKRA